MRKRNLHHFLNLCFRFENTEFRIISKHSHLFFSTQRFLESSRSLHANFFATLNPLMDSQFTFNLFGCFNFIAIKWVINFTFTNEIKKTFIAWHFIRSVEKADERILSIVKKSFEWFLSDNCMTKNYCKSLKYHKNNSITLRTTRSYLKQKSLTINGSMYVIG